MEEWGMSTYIGVKMNRLSELLRAFLTKFIDLLVILLFLAFTLMVTVINGVMISNIINSFLARDYVDSTIGIQVVLVIMFLVWVPYLVVQMINKK